MLTEKASNKHEQIVLNLEEQELAKIVLDTKGTHIEFCCISIDFISIIEPKQN